MIDIRQIRYFVALAETLHFGRAAERLRITQPPLSRQVAALEKELGVRLLDRHSRTATLTQAGQRFLEDARGVLASFDQACRNARLTECGELGELTVGFMNHAAYTVVPDLTRRFIAAFPQVEVKLQEIIPSSLVGDLLAGRVDAGIMFYPGAVRGLETREIYRETLCLAVHAAHPLVERPEVSAQDLVDQPLIATPAEVAPLLHAAILHYCRRAGADPKIRLEIQLQQTIISLVAENLGVALVPDSLRKLGVANVAFRPLADAPSIEHVIAWRPGNPNPTLKPFLETAGVALA